MKTLGKLVCLARPVDSGNPPPSTERADFVINVIFY